MLKQMYTKIRTAGFDTFRLLALFTLFDICLDFLKNNELRVFNCLLTREPKFTFFMFNIIIILRLNYGVVYRLTYRQYVDGFFILLKELAVNLYL